MCPFQDLGCKNAGFLAHPTPRQCCSQVRRKVHAFENFLNTCPRLWLLKMKRIVYDISVKERFVWSKATVGFLEEAFWDVTQGKEAKSYSEAWRVNGIKYPLGSVEFVEASSLRLVSSLAEHSSFSTTAKTYLFGNT